MQNGIRIYRYPGARALIPYTLMIVAGGMLIGGSVTVEHLSTKGAIDGNPLVFQIIFGIALFGCILGMRLNYFASRPIVVTEKGIAAVSWGGQRHFIDWANVARVEKVRFYDPLYSRVGSSFIFFAPARKIRFSDGILGINDLLPEVNGYIHQYHIPTYLRDGTRKASRSTNVAANSMEEHAVKLRGGVVTKIESLEV